LNHYKYASSVYKQFYMKKYLIALLVASFPLFTFAQITSKYLANIKQSPLYVLFDKLEPCAASNTPLSVIFTYSTDFDTVHVKMFVHSFMLLQHTKIGDTINFVSIKDRLSFANMVVQPRQTSERNTPFSTYQFSVPTNRLKNFVDEGFTRVEIKYQARPELGNYFDSVAQSFGGKVPKEDLWMIEKAATPFTSKSNKVEKWYLDKLKMWLE